MLKHSFYNIMFTKSQFSSPDPALSFEQQCRAKTPDDLTETQPCGNMACPQYEWEVGEWTACIVQNTGNQSVL